MIDHDFGLLANGFVVRFDVAADFLQRLGFVEIGVILHRLGHMVETVHRRVVRYHIKDETLLDRLLGGVSQFLRRAELHRVAGLDFLAEQFQRLVLGRRRECEIAGVGQHLAGLDALFDFLVHRILGDVFLEGFLVGFSA